MSDPVEPLTHLPPDPVPERLRVTIRRGKTEPEGAGATIAIPEGCRLQPTILLEAWLADYVRDAELFGDHAVDGFL